MQNHGGDLDGAMAMFGGAAADWIDLSTGINRVPYPLPRLPREAWTALPSRGALDLLHRTAQHAYGSGAAILATAGAQAAIQMIPWLAAPGIARIVAPTYSEHAICLRAVGWTVQEVSGLAALAGAELAVVVNPNNPGGQAHRPEDILAMSGRVGQLIVDESFADPVPELSVASNAGLNGMKVLRSFGKFYGLAGIRLGFVLGPDSDIALMEAMSGPWPVSGPAIAIGQAALADRDWAAATTARLRADARRLDAMALAAGWQLAGGTQLFRLYETRDAAKAQVRLARARIWSRVFPYSPTWVRLGLPGTDSEWERVRAALASGLG